MTYIPRQIFMYVQSVFSKTQFGVLKLSFPPVLKGYMKNITCNLGNYILWCNYFFLPSIFITKIICKQI